MSANFPLRGDVRQLDRRAEPPAEVSDEQVQDPSRLSRLLMTLLRDVALLKRRWWPDRLDFEDRDVIDDGTTKYRFTHNFGGRVRWWVIDWTSDDGGVDIVKDDETDGNTLVIRSYCTGTMVMRVEEAG